MVVSVVLLLVPPLAELAATCSLTSMSSTDLSLKAAKYVEDHRSEGSPALLAPALLPASPLLAARSLLAAVRTDAALALLAAPSLLAATRTDAAFLLPAARTR